MTIIVADSGLGGLDVAAKLLTLLSDRAVHIEYFNARLPGNGYNAMPDAKAKADALDAALAGMMKRRPDRIVFACNTMSVIYPDTAFASAPPVPVSPIVDAAAEVLFRELCAAPRARMILFGTETTVGSGIYQRRLIERGIAPERIMECPCPHLGPAIEHIPGAPDPEMLLDRFAMELREKYGDDGQPLLAGFCCTHYGYLKSVFLRALGGQFRGKTTVADPGAAFAAALAVGIRERLPAGKPSITVNSRAGIAPEQRLTVAEYLRRESSACAEALLECRPDAGLF